MVEKGPRAGRLLIDWLREEDVKVLNVAGHRASTHPDLGAEVEDFLARVFREMRPGG